MPTEDLIAGLQARRDELAAELAALDGAIAALGGGGTSPIPELMYSAGKRVSVGDDKLRDVLAYIRKHGEVRQADITEATGFNSGTVSQATQALRMAGAIERGPKENRSITWRVRDDA